MMLKICNVLLLFLDWCPECHLLSPAPFHAQYWCKFLHSSSPILPNLGSSNKWLGCISYSPLLNLLLLGRILQFISLFHTKSTVSRTLWSENTFRAGDSQLLSMYLQKKCWKYIRTVKNCWADLEFIVQCKRSETNEIEQ